MADDRISVYNAQELKNTTDDALGNYLRSLAFKQDNTKTDVKLVTGYVAIIIAAITFVADYKLGWEQTKYWTALAVFLYAALNTFYTYWTWFVEKGLIFEGSKDGRKISIRTKVNKHDPTYFVEIDSTDSPTSTPSTRQIKTPFTTWFTADGFFVAQPFQQWLASSVEIIGDADPKNSLRDQRDKLAAPASTTGVEAAAAAAAAGQPARRKK